MIDKFGFSPPSWWERFAFTGERITSPVFLSEDINFVWHLPFDSHLQHFTFLFIFLFWILILIMSTMSEYSIFTVYSAIKPLLRPVP